MNLDHWSTRPYAGQPRRPQADTRRAKATGGRGRTIRPEEWRRHSTKPDYLEAVLLEFFTCGTSRFLETPATKYRLSWPLVPSKTLLCVIIPPEQHPRNGGAARRVLLCAFRGTARAVGTRCSKENAWFKGANDRTSERCDFVSCPSLRRVKQNKHTQEQRHDD